MATLPLHLNRVSIYFLTNEIKGVGRFSVNRAEYRLPSIMQFRNPMFNYL